MSEHRATVVWQRTTPDFVYETYSRNYFFEFEGGIRFVGTAAPTNIPKTSKTSVGVDPEQAFVAAISSCHMLWFMHWACQAGFIVDRYADDAIGTLAKNAAGKLAITRVVLRPVVTFGGKSPTSQEFADLHEHAHARCFIANSVNSEIVLEPRLA